MLSPLEVAKIHKFLGYPLTTGSQEPGMGWGVVDKLQTAIPDMVANLIPMGEELVREFITRLECIEKQLANQRGDLAVLAVGSVQLAGRDGMSSVEDEYRKWAKKLSDTLAIPLYRHSSYQREIGSFSGRVIEQC